MTAPTVHWARTKPEASIQPQPLIPLPLLYPQTPRPPNSPFPHPHPLLQPRTTPFLFCCPTWPNKDPCGSPKRTSSPSQTVTPRLLARVHHQPFLLLHHILHHILHQPWSAQQAQKSPAAVEASSSQPSPSRPGSPGPPRSLHLDRLGSGTRCRLPPSPPRLGLSVCPQPPPSRRPSSTRPSSPSNRRSQASSRRLSPIPLLFPPSPSTQRQATSLSQQPKQPPSHHCHTYHHPPQHLLPQAPLCCQRRWPPQVLQTLIPHT